MTHIDNGGGPDWNYGENGGFAFFCILLSNTHAQYGGIKLNVTSATKCDQCDKGTSKSYP